MRSANALENIKICFPDNQNMALRRCNPLLRQYESDTKLKEIYTRP